MTNKNIIELTDDNFDSHVKKGNLVVDFWASWCGPCRMMEPHFEEAAEELKGKVKFAKVNVEQNSDLANRFQVMSIPTIIYFKDGEQVNRVTGAMPSDEIVASAEESFG